MDEDEPTRRGRAAVLLRRLGASAFLIVGTLVAAAISLVPVWREQRPDLALELWPFDARAMATSAQQQSQAAGGAGVSPASKRMLERALRRDATVVSAWRTLGVRAYGVGQREAGLHYLLISQSLSARDAPTQLLLIEDAAQRGDLDDAIRHYDVALRTSLRSADLLLPALVSATKERIVAEKVARLLLRDPPWSVRFIDYFAQNAPTAEAAIQLVGAVPKEVRIEYLDSFKKLIPLLIERGDYRQAATVYSLLSGGPTQGVRDAHFNGRSRFPPFEWELTDTPELRAERVATAGSASQAGLRVYAANGAIATIARQLVILRPGPYRLTSQVRPQSGAPVDRLLWRVSCAGSEGKLVELDTRPEQAGSKVANGTFVVPGNCPAQWLSLEVTAAESSTGSQAWIDGVEVTGASDGATNR